MDRSEWFLATITFLVAVIAHDTVTGVTTPLFRGIGGTVALLVVYLLPVYLLAEVARDADLWAE
jgi:hypothetical protein